MAKAFDSDIGSRFHAQALMMGEVVKSILDTRLSLFFSNIASVELRPVTEFCKRMRVTSLEKFDTTTYISYINFYASEELRDSGQALGVVVVYVEEEYLIDLMKKFDYPFEDDDDTEAFKDACGTICNLIAGKFKANLAKAGYIELVMSHFHSYQNEILEGVEYNCSQNLKYEINFELKGQKCFVVDYNMGNIPQI